MTVRIGNPFAMFFDRYGVPLDGGNVYIGEEGEDPEVAPIDVFWDNALSVPAAQPLDTIGGIINRNGDPAFAFVAEDNHSIRVRDADGAEVFYAATTIIGGVAYQPLDSTLTALAALADTPYGRGLLEIATAADLRDYAGIVEPDNPTESLIVAASDEGTAITAGAGKTTFRLPYALTLTGVKASLTTAQVGGAILTVDINENGVSILSTKITIDNGEKTSTTAAVAAVISDTSLAADSEITIDVDQVGDGTAKGLKVTLIGAQP